MTTKYSFTKGDLLSLVPRHATFVGIDSDGCVFDTMEIKQKKCFHKLIVSHWHMQPIERYVRESAEFVNLYSKYRGHNRFPCLVMTFDFLRDRPEAIASGIEVPRLDSLRKFIDSGRPLSNSELAKETGDAELASVLEWSKAVNAEIARIVKNVPPFKWVAESLRMINENSDAICVSQTPAEALLREWQEHGLMDYVSVIAGQELGTKKEHLQMATQGRYTPGKVLMIGDALGDFNAARGVNAGFYPIEPGHETESWERFHEEAYRKFLQGEYKGAYENKLIEAFEKLLPAIPPWKKGERKK